MRSTVRLASLAVLTVAVVGAPLAARAQAVIKVNDSVSVKIGFLSQTWADFSQNVRQDTSYAQNVFQRRMRFLVGAQVGPHFSFFFETDNPNLGRSGPGNTRSLGTGFITQDAFVEVKPGMTNSFLIDAGLQLVPLCRNCIASAASLLPIDYGAYSFLQSGPTGSSVGRDVGFLAKGYLMENHFEYRAGIFSGLRLPTAPAGVTQTATNSLRASGRVAYNFLEAEAPAYALAGTYLGKKKLFQVGAGIDGQSDYRAIAADAFFSYPIGTDGITIDADFVHYDGHGFIALAKQNNFLVEAGYHLNTVRWTPWVKLETHTFDSGVKSVANQDESRIQAGVSYYIIGNNLNVKLGYARNNFDRAGLGGGVLQNLSSLHQNAFTLQLQGFYY